MAAVNAFRTANGLPALQIDNSLMAAAQAQSDYQAAIRQVTHVGAGGTSATQRAIAYGFGGGAQVFVSENIAGGINLTINQAIYEYWQDSLHLQTMLNPAALYIGAGVGVADNYVYITVDAGYYVGAPGSDVQATPAPGATYAPPTTSGPKTDPFIVSTPREDGAIVHTVGYGQSLIGIANTYKVQVAEVLKLNELTLDSIIYPGDEIVIQPSHTPTLTGTPEPATATPTSSLTVTPGEETQTPKWTATARNTATASPSFTPTPIVISPAQEPVVVVVVLISLGIFLIVVFSGLLKRG
ncbi:MAG: CAP domain-containing protein [Chloroflexota bacterium]